MTCIIQEPRNRFFLTESGAWTSDINEAMEFKSVRQTIEHKERLQLHHATVLVFRDKSVYRLDPEATLHHSEDKPEFLPVDDDR